MVSSRTILVCALVCSIMSNLGCSSFWHDLQPSRLNRLNRGPAPSLDPEFSQNLRGGSTRLVKRGKKSPTLSVNTAEISVVRAQSPK
jgi:hypothetical protein